MNVAVYFAQILKIFAQIMANFSALGVRPHTPHPHSVRFRCTGVHTFGDAKNFCPNLILFFSNNVQTGNLNVKTKMYHCKQIKVSACLTVIFTVLKNVS